MSLENLILASLIALMALTFQFKILPIIKVKFKAQPEIMSPIEPTEQVKFELVYSLKQEGFEILTGPNFRSEIKGIEFLLKIKGRPIKVIFSSQKESQSQLASLQLILKKSKIEKEKPIKMIDLSGSKPYVAF